MWLERPILLQSHRQSGGWGHSDKILHVFFHTDYHMLPILQFYMFCIHLFWLQLDIGKDTLLQWLYMVFCSFWMLPNNSWLVSYFPFFKISKSFSLDVIKSLLSVVCILSVLTSWIQMISRPEVSRCEFTSNCLPKQLSHSTGGNQFSCYWSKMFSGHFVQTS